jgi:hypothetical protein
VAVAVMDGASGLRPHDSIYGEKDVGPSCTIVRHHCVPVGRCHARLYSLIDFFPPIGIRVMNFLHNQVAIREQKYIRSP